MIFSTAWHYVISSSCSVYIHAHTHGLLLPLQLLIYSLFQIVCLPAHQGNIGGEYPAIFPSNCVFHKYSLTKPFISWLQVCIYSVWYALMYTSLMLIFPLIPDSIAMLYITCTCMHTCISNMHIHINGFLVGQSIYTTLYRFIT